MLFSTPVFLIGFLPITLIAFHYLRVRSGGRTALAFIAAASVFFYAWWNPPFVLLLLGSMVLNFTFARLIGAGGPRYLLTFAVLGNLAVLGYFKYRNFFLENVGFVLGETWSFEPVFVPLAISFFTFQQIALLCDVADGKAKVEDPVDYAAFIALFPQLIAGPIVLYREMREQFAELRDGGGVGLTLLGPGIAVFALGLFKKVVLADSLAPYADTAFANAESLTFLEAWASALTYSLQLYFDFSGYSDMAVGLGLMLGLRLPVNFDTPFRACSMIDFWKRWHITMTRFFMMYLYSPIALAVTRWSMERSLPRGREFAVAVAFPIGLTFLLSGLWHGAAWTFVAFGAVNAIGLIANHGWKKAKAPKLPKPLGWLLTMLVVMVSFVYFRATSLADAHAILTAMVSPGLLILPNWLAGPAETLGLSWQTLSFFATGSYTVKLVAWLVVLAPLSLLLPNWATSFEKLKPDWRLATLVAVMIVATAGLLDRPQAFIYFQF